MGTLAIIVAALGLSFGIPVVDDYLGFPEVSGFPAIVHDVLHMMLGGVIVIAFVKN